MVYQASADRKKAVVTMLKSNKMKLLSKTSNGKKKLLPCDLLVLILMHQTTF